MKEPNLTSFIKGRRALTPWMAWAFARVLQTKPEYWMVLQVEYDLWQAQPRWRIRRVKPGPRSSQRHRRRRTT
jgi:plasmid maintenance system antidote protein VapI